VGAAGGWGYTSIEEAQIPARLLRVGNELKHRPIGILRLRQLLEISREMRESNPVFIVGEARSGTSILYRTLMKHPTFRPRHPNLVETEIFAHLRRIFMFGKNYPEPLIRYMLDDHDAYSAFLASIRVVRLVSALNAPINIVVRRPANWSWYGNLSHLLLRSYFFHATRARGCDRLVEKTPTNTPFIAPLSTTFPKARLLYIHRHPVDVFSSYRRRGQADPGAAWARGLAPEPFCEIYERSANRVLDWIARGNSNLLLIRYEDFTRHPTREFKRLCGFLEEPFDSSAVEEATPHVGRWKGDPLLWGPIVAVTKHWQDFMTMAEAEWIQARLGRTMERLGHEQYERNQAERPS
jgi:hypothetical protein